MENTKTKGILRSIGSETKENTNGTLFRTCTVDIQGNVYWAKIWEKSVSRAEIGQEYTVEAQLDGDTVWLTVLPGSDAKIATAADFAHLFPVTA